eukprot:1143796-Pelagomonas_calceolata.AAC.1
MGMKFARKFNGTSVVKFQLFKLVKGMLSTTRPTNTQNFLEGWPSVFIECNLYQAYVPLVHTQLVRWSNTGSCVGRLWGAVPAA